MAGSEALYDDEIAPMLMAVAEKCRAAGMSIAALVEWEPGGEGRGLTQIVQPDASLGFRIAHRACAPGATIDGLIMATAKYIREHDIPHTSVVLQQAGVDPDPAAR